MDTEVKQKSNPLMTNFFSPTSSPNQPTKPKGHTVQISTSDVDDEDDHDSTDVSGEVGSSKRNKFGLRICPRSGLHMILSGFSTNTVKL